MFPDTKFIATVLARENQHELCVLARKFRNLHIFGCWWFLNNPSLIDEMTRMRLELLGLSFTPQHSDARVLDQLHLQVAALAANHLPRARGKIRRPRCHRLGADARRNSARREEAFRRRVR